MSERSRPAPGRRSRPGEHLLFPDAAGVQSERLCDHTSVGVLLVADDNRLLMFERATFPVGLAPVAGHVGDHGDIYTAASNEVAEEVGLTIAGTPEVRYSGWRPNTCRLTPQPGRTGHYWTVFVAPASGELAPSRRETRNARWMSLEEIAEHAALSVRWAIGQADDEEFAALPGLALVWVCWIAEWFEHSGRPELAAPLAPHLGAIDRLWRR